jgi:hypothetical protein
MRQNFVPWISFHAKFEVTVPDGGGNAILHLACRHVVIKFRATRHRVARRGEKLAGTFEDFGNGVNESLVIARLMPFERRHNWGHDVLRATMFGQEHFDTRAGGFRRFDEDESVLMGQDH